MTKLSDESALLREAIHSVLATATEPLTSVQIGEATPVRSLGLDPLIMPKMLYQLVKRKAQTPPVKRTMYTGKGHALYGYYNPDVIQPFALAPDPIRPEPIEEPVNGVNSFDPDLPALLNDPALFNPMPVLAESPDPIVIPPGVKSITLSVAGVTIRIDMAP